MVISDHLSICDKLMPAVKNDSKYLSLGGRKNSGSISRNKDQALGRNAG